MRKNTRKEIRNKFIDEYKKIYSRKYRRAHYRNRWEIESDNHLAEEDFNNWYNESRIIKRKYTLGMITEKEFEEYLNKWNEQDLKVKKLIDEITISKNNSKTLDKI